MINWCQRKTLFLIICCSFWSSSLPTLAISEINLRSESNSSSTIKQKRPLGSWITLATRECEAINSAYQEVYSFETEDHLINICQLGNSFYYHRQSKLDQTNTILIPAQTVFGGDVFQASNGKTTYFVGKNGDRFYSSVMQNNNEIVFEPELPLPPANLSQNIAEANSSLPADLKSNRVNNASLELDSPVDNREQVLVCTREKSAFNPRLDGWQRLIGKSTEIVNEYAVSNGHEFVHNSQNSNLASIITKNGAIINLKITNASETIERVCIQPEGDN